MGKCIDCKWFNQDATCCRCFNPKQTDQSLINYCYYTSGCDLTEPRPTASDEEMEGMGYQKKWRGSTGFSNKDGIHYWELQTPVQSEDIGYSGFSGTGNQGPFSGISGYGKSGYSGYRKEKTKRLKKEILKKVLMLIPYFLLWILYFLLTSKERERYMMAKSRGYDCIASKDDSYIIPGSATIYTYDRNKKPTRRFLTWREFWKARGYCK